MVANEDEETLRFFPPSFALILIMKTIPQKTQGLVKNRNPKKQVETRSIAREESLEEKSSPHSPARVMPKCPSGSARHPRFFA